jgi:FkbM family methyltransferase
MSVLQRMPIVRSAVEALARGKKVRRRLPNGLNIYVSPDSQLKYLGSRFDIDLTDLARAKVSADSVVWDIGANCGVLAFSSSAAKQVVAVEADPFLCNLIQESMVLNGTPLVLVAAAAFSQTGIAEFSIAQRGRASNHLSALGGRSQTGGERARMLVPTITLDSLLDVVLPPTLVKIDVEGAEIEVLQGASRLLNEIGPIIYLETVDETHEACERILAAAGYELTKGAEMNWMCVPR